ncbi:MAG: amine oxidase [Acidobacteriota bacterium]
MRIAVVGGGIAGLVAARELARAGHGVTLFERERRPGGHAATVEVEDAGVRFPVDLGFLVYNERNYPLFARLLAELGVATAPSSMGFAVEDPATGFLLSGDRAGALFARRRNLVDPRFWRVAAGQLAFARAGRRELAAGRLRPLAELVREARLPRDFVELYLLPMAGAIWSMAPADVLDFPAAALVRFFDNHGLLTLLDRPAWRTVAGGSRRYVEALVATSGFALAAGARVTAVRRPAGGGVELAVDGERLGFHRLVLATHADQALALLADPTPVEREVLGAFRYRDNEVVLHDDASLLPPPRARASWNVRLGGDDAGIGVTYLLNKLQPLPVTRPWCVTLNRTAEIDPARIRHRTVFAHPQLDRAAIEAQGRWREISGPRDTFYAGAAWRYGFHEDGAWSGVRAAAAADASVRAAAA